MQGPATGSQPEALRQNSSSFPLDPRVHPLGDRSSTPPPPQAPRKQRSASSISSFAPHAQVCHDLHKHWSSVCMHKLPGLDAGPEGPVPACLGTSGKVLLSSLAIHQQLLVSSTRQTSALSC